MSTYSETGRSNYFRVKDLSHFEADLEMHLGPHGGDILIDPSRDPATPGAICLLATEGWPWIENQTREERAEEYGWTTCLRPEPGEDAVTCVNCDFDLEEHVRLPEGYEWPGPAEDFLALIARHLVVGDVAVIQWIGQEKLRYLSAGACAVNSKNERAVVNLDDIYDLAKGLGESVTIAAE